MDKIGFLALSAKMVVNVCDLNNEGSIGQTTDIRMIRMVGEDGGELPEAPAVSGRMLKHWHLEYLLREELSRDNDKKLCNRCKAWQPDRQSDAKDENTGVKECVVCDIHGFLSTAKVQAPPRRTSCISFSWLLPVIGTYTPSKQVIHSRVEPSGTVSRQNAGSTGEGEERERETAQMIYYKSYASGVYGFVSSINLARIGKPLNGKGVVEQNEIKRRQKLAVKALLPMVLGAFGASQSHALPHTRCLSLLVALSPIDKPIPNLISPIYQNGFTDSIELLKKVDEVSYWTYGEELEGAKGTVQEIFSEVIAKIDEQKD
jgi:CRISPR-associated protein Cst2